MKWKLSKSNFLYLLVIILLLLYIVLKNGIIKINENFPVGETLDTTYNTVVLDSIKYNIIIKDSIIYDIKHEYEIKYIEANNLDDSNAVELFKSLCSDNSLYGRGN